MSDCRAPRRVVHGLLVAFGLLAPLLGGCRAERADAAIASRLSASLFDDRFTVGRLVGQTGWRSCVRADTTGALKCSAPPRSSNAFVRLAAESRAARQRLDSDSTIEALHDAALLALRLRDSISTGLNDAARFLVRARAQAKNAAILNDLAVVQLELGEREQTIRPFLAALDAIERAVATDSTLVPALFNRALILERLHLLAIAQRAWSRYLNVETDAAWRREARLHMKLLASEAESALLSQGGRDTVFQLLGDWGHAIARHDDSGAAAVLSQVHRIVALLDSLHGDQSARLTVALVDSQVRLASRSAGGRRTLERLAAAHAELGDGYGSYKYAMYDRATGLLDHTAQELRSLRSAAAGWAALYLASTELNLSEFDAADRRLRRVAADASPQQPALSGKAVWTLGVIQVRRGNYESANGYYRAAAPYMARSNEPENDGAISYLIAESLGAAGQYAAGDADAYRALRLLAPYRKSHFLNNHLKTVATYARADRLRFAAPSVMDEVLSVARAMQSPDALGLTYQMRASDLAAVGQRDSALAELASALEAIEPLTGRTKDRYRADIQLVQGQIARADDPRGALLTLATVASEYQRLGVFSRASAALYEAAVAARAAGDTVRARGWLGDAIAQIERQQATFETSEGRAALFETADNAFDAMIDLELHAGHADSAFLYLERERAAAKPSEVRPHASGRANEVPSLEAVRQQLPASMLFVEYALLGDRTIAWTASRRGVNHYVISAPRDTIAALVEQFVHERTIPAARDGDARSRLFDLLLRPLARELEGVDQITVVCDRELARLPLAALWDRASKRYVIEGYTVRTEPSAAFFLAAQDMAGAPELRRTALVVGNPVLDTLSIRLEALPGAAREARQVADLYRTPTLLLGAAARRDSVLSSLLRTPRVFHFAGHAVFNGDRPELSYLALGVPSDGKGTGALEAREIGELRLSNLEIVVLSACQTLGSRTSRTGAVAGLASSFLRAGAPAIISTLWDVSDDMTGPLLTSFHKRFAAGASAADALRAAQLEALKGRPGQLTAPAIWAAFIYAGP